MLCFSPCIIHSVYNQPLFKRHLQTSNSVLYGANAQDWPNCFKIEIWFPLRLSLRGITNDSIYWYMLALPMQNCSVSCRKTRLWYWYISKQVCDDVDNRQKTICLWCCKLWETIVSHLVQDLECVVNVISAFGITVCVIRSAFLQQTLDG